MITASVVGVIANLTLWLTLHVLFATYSPLPLPWGQMEWPDIASLDGKALGLAILAGVLLFRFHAGDIKTLAACVTVALALHGLGV